MKINCFKQAGFTLLETMTAAFITTIVLASAGAGAIALQKSFMGNRAYMKGNADNNRLIDYVTRDIRNAIKIGKLVGTATTPLKVATDSFDISQTDQLSLFVPDFYQTNVPDNSYQSAYKTSYFSRSRLAAGQTYFPYNDVVKVVGIRRVPNYPASIEIRYLKKARSSTDSTLCYFRDEYEGTTLRRSDEIADRAADERIRIRVIDTEKFQISSSFASRWTGEAAREGTRQFSTVSIQNFRTDK